MNDLDSRLLTLRRTAAKLLEQSLITTGHNSIDALCRGLGITDGAKEDVDIFLSLEQQSKLPQSEFRDCLYVLLLSEVANYEFDRGLLYTVEVKTRALDQLDRIITQYQSKEYQSSESLEPLLKDLKLCSGNLFPAAARVIEPSSGFSRSLAFSNGPKGLIDMLRLTGPCLVNTPYFLLHLHTNNLDEFSEDGWVACLQVCADMLALNSSIRGVWAGSWLYDPQLSTVSPHLAYIRDIALQSGAISFYMESQPNGGALAKSKSRKKAFDAGVYMPEAYAVIWSRKALIAWSN